MNHQLISQIRIMSTNAKTFIAIAQNTALSDDGKESRAEHKALEKIKRATEDYVHELEKAEKILKQ